MKDFNKTEVLVEEINNLHHLLNGYNSILYRYHVNAGKKLIKIAGRPDRMRNKYSTNDGIGKLHDVDEIFPIYQNYFNVSDVTNSDSLEEIINRRVQNIKHTLENLEQEVPSQGVRLSMNFSVFTLLVLSTITFKKCVLILN